MRPSVQRAAAPFGAVALKFRFFTSSRCGVEAPAQAACSHRWAQCPSLVVADDFAVPLEHQLGNASALDAPLGAFVVLLHPVVKNLAVYLDAAFFPHNRVPPFVLL